MTAGAECRAYAGPFCLPCRDTLPPLCGWADPDTGTRPPGGTTLPAAWVVEVEQVGVETVRVFAEYGEGDPRSGIRPIAIPVYARTADDRLREARAAAGLTLREAAQATGLTVADVSDLERGLGLSADPAVYAEKLADHAKADLEALRAIADYTKADLDALRAKLRKPPLRRMG